MTDSITTGVSSAEPERGDLARFRDKKILVAEDNKINSQLIQLQLQSFGLDSDMVNDGLEVLSAVEKKHYDLVLMDWQMPRMSGLEATRKIREQGGHKDIVIIAVTANAMSGDVDACLDAGMNDYISKPVKRDELSIKLAKWLA
jgi:two-component system, sensor histidine kinase and response regulator